MKMLPLILYFATGISILADTLWDPTDPDGIGKIATTSVDHSHIPLALNLNVEEKTTPTRVIADITVYNNTDHIINIMLRGIFRDFHFRVTENSDSPVSPKKRYSDYIMQPVDSAYSEPLNPGQYRHFYLNLSKEYDFKSGQSYVVQVSTIVFSNQKGEPKPNEAKLISPPVNLTAP
jgi:hypothetical protein